MNLYRTILIFTTLAATILSAPGAWPHCDTVEGPVVHDARRALEKQDVTPVLKWISDEDEPEIREAFEKTLAVRTQSEAAREMADYYFFETLVRVHRATEGFGYTGLRSISTVDPVLVEADEALESGSAEELIEHLTRQVERELRERFEKAHENKQHADDSVRQGRDYVQSYVQFVHFVEAIREAVTSEDFHHSSAKPHESAHDEQAGD